MTDAMAAIVAATAETQIAAVLSMSFLWISSTNSWQKHFATAGLMKCYVWLLFGVH
jgi:hypothetical protein